MLFCFGCALNMQNLVAVCLQVISDQSTMTSPPNCFGAHNRYARLSRQIEQALNSISESFGLHIVGIASESIVSPCGVVRVRLRASPAAEFRQVMVFNGCLPQCFGQLFFAKMRIPARARKMAHIDQ
jgi:hypothetical protein